MTTIGGLAAAGGVGVETVRYYQRRGLMETPPRDGGVRRYGAGDIRRLRFIRQAQAAGFSLDEIAELIALDASRDRPRARESARARIAARGCRATAGDIRRCRQDMIREAEHWKMLIGGEDFYSMSGCRDLLFNVMEHRFTLPEIAAFLNDNDLSFLSFEPFDDPTVIEKFHKRLSGAADEANLDQWHRFEADHPETFWDMYVFTVAKNAH